MHAFLISLGVVTLAEIGDKTQLLALILAARYRKPWAIVAGILCATIANHGLAAALGVGLAELLGPEWIQRIAAIGFIAMAFWILIPDKADDEESKTATERGAFIATLITFFLVEIGDKTQLATVALAARYNDILMVAAGTTAGMMLADVPVVFLGDNISRRLPLKYIRWATAASFLALGIAALLWR